MLRIINENVDVLQLLGQFFQELPYIVGLRYIEFYRVNFYGRIVLFDFSLELFENCQSSGGKDKIDWLGGDGSGEFERGGFSDAGRGTCDENLVGFLVSMTSWEER